MPQTSKSIQTKLVSPEIDKNEKKFVFPLPKLCRSSVNSALTMCLQGNSGTVYPNARFAAGKRNMSEDYGSKPKPVDRLIAKEWWLWSKRIADCARILPSYSPSWKGFGSTWS